MKKHEVAEVALAGSEGRPFASYLPGSLCPLQAHSSPGPRRTEDSLEVRHPGGWGAGHRSLENHRHGLRLWQLLDPASSVLVKTGAGARLVFVVAVPCLLPPVTGLSIESLPGLVPAGEWFLAFYVPCGYMTALASGVRASVTHGTPGQRHVARSCMRLG